MRYIYVNNWENNFDRSHNLSRFAFVTPFTKEGKAHGNVKDQYKRRTLLTTEHRLVFIFLSFHLSCFVNKKHSIKDKKIYWMSLSHSWLHSKSLNFVRILLFCNLTIFHILKSIIHSFIFILLILPFCKHWFWCQTSKGKESLHR